MRLSGRARTVFGAGAALLLGGILGLTWWIWRRRSGRDRDATSRRARIAAALTAVGLALIAVGATWRVVVAVRPVPVCTGPASVHVAAGGRSLDAALVGEKVATWPETGLAMLYARIVGAPDCRSRAADYYVVIHANRFAGDRAVNMGDIVLSPRFELSRQQMIDLAAHEARHRPQWAVATVIGGPFAFPVVYTVDDFFFPGPRNHFERMAGLESGGYQHEGHGPVLGPPQIAVLCAVPVAIAGGWLVVRRRRRRSRTEHRAPSPATKP